MPESSAWFWPSFFRILIRFLRIIKIYKWKETKGKYFEMRDADSVSQKKFWLFILSSIWFSLRTQTKIVKQDSIETRLFNSCGTPYAIFIIINKRLVT